MLCHTLIIPFYVFSILHPFHRLLCSVLSALSDEIRYLDKHAVIVPVSVRSEDNLVAFGFFLPWVESGDQTQVARLVGGKLISLAQWAALGDKHLK